MPNQHPKGAGKTIQELAAGITPMLPGQPERIPWTWFDTQTYTTAVTTTLDFFQSVNADKNLSNMVAAGQIPAPQFFDLYHASIAYLLPVTASAIIAAPTAAGAVTDVRNLSNGAAVLTIADKNYWQGSQFMLPCGGGPQATVAVAGVVAAPNFAQYNYANNGDSDLRNRYNFWGDITLPANQNFVWRLTWSAPITLFATSLIRVWMDGYLYRRVL